MVSGPESLTNAQKLSLPTNTPIGTQVQVTDGFVVSGAGSPEVNLFYRDIGDGGSGKHDYVSTDNATLFHWEILADVGTWELIGADYFYISEDDVQYPWQATTWIPYNSGVNPPPILTHPAVQELTAPSTAQGGVFVNGGTQDGIYTNRGIESGKVYGTLLGQSDSIEFSAVSWTGSQWQFWNSDNETVYYSLTDVATPDLAGSDKSVMAVSGIAYSKRGTFNGKSYYNKIGEATSTSLSAIFWSSATWHITNAVGVDLDTSTSAVATPDLATFLLSTTVTNTAWLNASDDSPASITVTNVTQGELDAGVLVTGAGTSAENGSFTVGGNNHARNSYGKVGIGWSNETDGLEYNGDSWRFWLATANTYFDTADPAFPFSLTLSVAAGGTSPAPTITRNDVASEANWNVV